MIPRAVLAPPRDSNELAPLARGAFSFKARCPSLVVSGVLNSFRDRSASAHETSGRKPKKPKLWRRLHAIPVLRRLILRSPSSGDSWPNMQSIWNAKATSVGGPYSVWRNSLNAVFRPTAAWLGQCKNPCRSWRPGRGARGWIARGQGETWVSRQRPERQSNIDEKVPQGELRGNRQ